MNFEREAVDEQELAAEVEVELRDLRTVQVWVEYRDGSARTYVAMDSVHLDGHSRVLSITEVGEAELRSVMIPVDVIQRVRVSSNRTVRDVVTDHVRARLAARARSVLLQ